MGLAGHKVSSYFQAAITLFWCRATPLNMCCICSNINVDYALLNMSCICSNINVDYAPLNMSCICSNINVDYALGQLLDERQWGCTGAD